MKPRYCSPSACFWSSPSAICCRAALVRGLERSSGLTNSAAAVRRRSRSSRVSGTTFRCAVLGRFSFFVAASGSAAVGTFGSSKVAIKARALRRVGGAASELLASPAEGRHGEDYRIEFLKIPQLCKIKSNRNRVFQAPGFHLFDEPGEPLIHR